MIKQLLTICPDSSIFGVGGRSVVLSITEHIAAKVAYKTGDSHLRHEQTIFELLDDRAPCPYIIQSFFRAADVTFMQLVKNETLHERMEMENKPRHVLPWMQQLSDAVACIESIGYAHGDINPRNILLDDEDQLKLVDFDHARKIGEDIEVGYEPYVRFRNATKDSGGSYGVAGPITEQFALGSIFWYITRGAELYADIEGPERLTRLMRLKFPATDTQDPIDKIISDCWLGKFQSIKDLSNHIRKVAAFNETYKEREKTCAQLYQLLSSPGRQK